MSSKICLTCNQVKPLGDFVRSQKNKKGETYQFERKKCIACISNRQKTRLIERFGYEGYIKYRKLEHLRRRCRQEYNITFEDAKTLLDTQNHQCAICRTPIEFAAQSYDKEACIDHCHSLKQPRGILCHWCNTGLGYFRDEPQRLIAAKTYLDGYSSKFVTFAVTCVAGVNP
jgi:hypothetical protein